MPKPETKGVKLCDLLAPKKREPAIAKRLAEKLGKGKK